MRIIIFKKNYLRKIRNINKTNTNMAAIVEFLFHTAAAETFMHGVHELYNTVDHYLHHEDHFDNPDSILAYPPPSEIQDNNWIHPIDRLPEVNSDNHITNTDQDTDIEIDWNNLGNLLII